VVRWFKALLATGIGFGPYAVKEYVKQFLGDHWTPWGLLGLAIAVVVGTWKFLEPDQRFLKVRDPALRTYLKQTLKGAESAGVSIRAHVFVLRGMWPIRWLAPAFSYKASATDPDYGKWWFCGRGLIWEVYINRVFGLFLKGRDLPANYRMSKRDIAQTDHVTAVFAVPIRKIPSSGSNVDGKIVAILSFDSSCDKGKDFLITQYGLMIKLSNREIVDLVDAVSVYF
jgi:hypothetical protein